MTTKNIWTGTNTWRSKSDDEFDIHFIHVYAVMSVKLCGLLSRSCYIHVAIGTLNNIISFNPAIYLYLFKDEN
jgi:hypothetical protein